LFRSQSLSAASRFAIAETRAPVDPAALGAQATDDGPSGIDLVTDWYAARKASALVFRFVPESRMALYRALIAAYAMRSWPDPDCLQSRLKLFFEMMARYLDEEPAVRGAAE